MITRQLCRTCRRAIVLLVFTALLVAGCSGPSTEGTSSPPSSSVTQPAPTTESSPPAETAPTSTLAPLPPLNGVASGLPNLTTGQHVGFKSFSDLDASQLAEVEVLTDEAVAAGVDIARVFLDWNEVEPTLGNYQFGELRGELAAAAERGQQLMIGLLVGGGEELPVVPLEFVDPEATGLGLDGFRDDLSFHSPEVIEAYLAMLDEIMPELVDAGIWGITVSNEPDNGFSAMSPRRAMAEVDSLARLMVAIREHVQAIDPGIAVTFTMSGFSILDPNPALHTLIEASDIVSSNFGCLNPMSFEMSASSSIASMIDALVELGDGRDVIIQELSCQSGPSDGESLTGSSLEGQAEWFDAFYMAMEERPELRAVYVLDLVDWPPHLGAEFTDFLRGEGIDEIADKYQEVLETWGLVTFDMDQKPAWDGFLAASMRFAALRGN